MSAGQREEPYQGKRSAEKKGLVDRNEGLLPDFSVGAADGTGVILGQIHKSRPGRVAMPGLSSLRVVDVPAGYAEVSACPLFQGEKRSRSRSTDWADIIRWQIFKGGPGGYFLPRLPTHGLVDVATNPAPIWLYALCHKYPLEENAYRSHWYSAR